MTTAAAESTAGHGARLQQMRAGRLVAVAPAEPDENMLTVPSAAAR